MPSNNAPTGTTVPQRPKPGELVRAAQSGNTQAVRDLLKRGANVNDRSGRGDTPLIWATYLEDKESVFLLVAHGADISARDDLGKSAMDWLVHSNKVEMMAVLNSAVEQRAEAKRQAQAAEKAHGLHDTAAKRQERLRGRAPKLTIRPV